MKLIGTVLRGSSRKVHSSGKETYVTNLLVLDPENSSGGTNYAVEVWDDKPHQVTPMSEIALTVTGVLSKSGGVPALRAVMAAQPPKPVEAEASPLPQGEKRAPNLRRDSAPEREAKPPLFPFRLRPTLEGGS
jgi:hypothetical protein